MAFKILMTANARRDLHDLWDYVAARDSPEKADYVLDKIQKALAALSENPDRGTFLKEFPENRDYRDILFKPYRLIYRLLEKKVYVLLIVDGRRDLVPLFQKRLLES